MKKKNDGRAAFMASRPKPSSEGLTAPPPQPHNFLLRFFFLGMRVVLL